MLIAVNHDLVAAIRDKRLVEFVYKFGGIRVVEPHDYGVHRGQASLLAYQLSGHSRSGAAHGWKHFKVDDMRHLRVLDRHFRGSRVDAAQHHRAWDMLFARVSEPDTDG